MIKKYRDRTIPFKGPSIHEVSNDINDFMDREENLNLSIKDIKIVTYGNGFISALLIY